MMNSNRWRSLLVIGLALLDLYLIAWSGAAVWQRPCRVGASVPQAFFFSLDCPTTLTEDLVTPLVALGFWTVGLAIWFKNRASTPVPVEFFLTGAACWPPVSCPGWAASWGNGSFTCCWSGSRPWPFISITACKNGAATMTPSIRIILADDHPLVRTGLRAILATESDIDLVGEATTGEEVQQLCLALQPDVLLLDLRMPGAHALDTMAFLRRHQPDLKIIVLTAYDDKVYIKGVTAAGAAGYILKDEAPEAVVQAIQTTARGGTWFSRPVVDKLI